MPRIEFKNVTKLYGNIVAAKDLNFEIDDGEYFGLIGPSGCGKTTTLRLLSGLITPTKGRIYINGKDVTHVPPHERKIGYVFQQFAVFPHMTVWENVAYAPTIQGKSNAEIEYLTEKALKMARIKHLEEQYPRGLSAPELQRIALARVLAAEAEILLFDEALGALDLKVREMFQRELRRLVKSQGLTAIHVTHDQAEALSICDRVAVMNKGRIVQIGPAEELLFNPKDVFISFFVGESDFMSGWILEKNKDFLNVQVGTYTIKAPLVDDLRVGERVIIAIRREFCGVAQRKREYEIDEKEYNKIPGIVKRESFTGMLKRVLIELDTRELIEAKIPSKSERFSEGERVSLYFPWKLTRIFKYPREGLTKALEM